MITLEELDMETIRKLPYAERERFLRKRARLIETERRRARIEKNKNDKLVKWGKLYMKGLCLHCKKPKEGDRMWLTCCKSCALKYRNKQENKGALIQ